MSDLIRHMSCSTMHLDVLASLLPHHLGQFLLTNFVNLDKGLSMDGSEDGDRDDESSLSELDPYIFGI